MYYLFCHLQSFNLSLVLNCVTSAGTSMFDKLPQSVTSSIPSIIKHKLKLYFFMTPFGGSGCFQRIRRFLDDVAFAVRLIGLPGARRE